MAAPRFPATRIAQVNQEEIPTPQGYGPFPTLPLDPDEEHLEPLPSLAEELALHGGAHLYEPEGEVAYALSKHHGELGHFADSHSSCRTCGSPSWHGCPSHVPPPCGGQHGPPLRLPETWCAPQPITLFADYLGADPIACPIRKWMGPCAYHWEPRFVAYGSYELLGFAFQEGGQRQDAIGHQALVDLDLQLTGTERIHMQFRPIGEKNTGGSFYQFNHPQGYVDNATGEPDRVWFEGEVASIFSGWIDDQFVPRDYMITAGLLPFQLQNFLLMNDDVAGIVLSKNNIYLGKMSNLNIQAFYFADEVDAFNDGGADLVGTNWQIDYRHAFIEATYGYVTHRRLAGRNQHYFALAGTKLCGPMTLAGRAMLELDGANGDGDGELFVVESNYTRIFTNRWAHDLDIHHGVFYANAFYASQGWAPISGGNFNRLRSAFEVDPLVAIARGVLNDTAGFSLGVQLFRDHENQSITPEVAFESPTGTPVWGFGLTYQLKASARSFWEFRGLLNWSKDQSLDRDGLFLSRTWLF